MAKSQIASVHPEAQKALVTHSRVAVADSRPWNAAVALVSSVLLAVLLFALVQRRALAPILVPMAGHPAPEPWLLPLALVSTSLILLMPGVVIAGLFAALRKHRSGRRAFIIISSLAMLIAMLDLDLLRSVGRHLAEVVAIAWQPDGHVAGGEFGNWAVATLKWTVLAVLLTLIVTACSQWLVLVVSPKMSAFLRHALWAASVVAVLMMIAAPLFLLQRWRRSPVVERFYANALFDARLDADSEDLGEGLDPTLRKLYPRFRQSYKAAFPGLTNGRPGDTAGAPLPARPPNVVMIVTESLRHDVFGAELMPRITRWAEGGMVSMQHDSSTMYSQSGMFALLYGRNPAVFHQTLDARVRPQFCESLRQRGYECAYFTGHPKVWQRREEFLNPETMDHFVHDDRGTWPEWDRRALDNMVEMVNASEKPIFAIVLLMSSHFEYQYPPEFEIDRPVSDTAWHVTKVRALGPDAEVPHRNRYRNCIRFIDDLVGRSIDRLDPERNLVLFTGDHGESINDDGHFTHGYTFAEIVTRTPFAMVGPNVKAGRLDQVTSHADVLPTVLHVLQGSPQAIQHIQGRDWLTAAPRASMLEAHSPPGGQLIEAQLRAQGRYLRINFSLTHPDLTLLGFEDNLGHLLPSPELSDSEMAGLFAALEDQLSLLRR